MKKTILFFAVASLVAVTSCKKKGCTDPTAINYDSEAEKDDGSCVDAPDETTVTVASNITTNTTWTADNVYVLASRVAVEAGAELTIEAGTIIKGQAGTGANATALLIARGGKLFANGTADAPIIFTSVADEIMPGEKVSPNLDPTLNGLWGGLIVLGYAPISAASDAIQIEGVPPSDANGLYGGSDAADNSGSITYVSIRHGGANIGEGNEINGLTLGGVGSGTTVSNIEVVGNQDDGIEFFGGTVNVSNALVWNAGDDAIDTDQAWSGTLDNFIVVNPGDECFELDGPEGSASGTHTITNGTTYAGGAQGLVDLDDNSNLVFTNQYFFGVADGQDFDQVPTADGFLDASNFQVTLPAGGVLTDFFKDGSDAFTTEVAEGANTVGADASVLIGWTWAGLSGNLSGF
tara:strand:+ start:2307 stop:3527 length:1221 start_codon:yes stop_codon:yes gene_type:complete